MRVGLAKTRKEARMAGEADSSSRDNLLEMLQECLDRGLEEQLVDDGQLVAEARWSNEGPVRDPFVDSPEPLVMRQRVLHWGALQKWTFQYLRDTCAMVRLPEDAHATKPSRECSLAELLTSVECGEAYLKDWWFQDDAPQLLDDMELPREFREDISQRLLGFRIMHLWAGGRGAKTRIHQDEPDVHVWSAQVSGVKRWALFPPNFLDDKLSQDANVFALLQRSARACGKVVTLFPGDVLIVPHKWFHSVRTLETGISVNGFHVTPDLLAPYLWTLMSWPLYFAGQVEGAVHLRDGCWSYMQRRVQYLQQRSKDYVMRPTQISRASAVDYIGETNDSPSPKVG